jgi:hypothetical protein
MPNIVNVSDIQGKTITSTLGSALTLSPTTSTMVIKVNSIVVAGDGTGGTASVSVSIGGVVGYIANSITVPANATLVALSKDTGIYLQWAASPNNSVLTISGSGCSAVVSYEEITTTS